MVENSKVLLVITGCIKPSTNQDHLILNDEIERLNQYISSIEFYIKKTTINKIVFCENSGYDSKFSMELCNVATLYKKDFEYLSFCSDNSLITKYSNKGIGEDEIMNYVCCNSRLYKDIDIIVKVTGRLMLLNIDNLIRNIDYNNYFFRDIYRGKPTGLDTRFYVILKSFYETNVRNCYKRINDYNIRYEELFYMLIHPYYSQLHEYMHFEGISAGNGINYSKISKTRIKVLDTLCKINIYNKYFRIIHMLNRIYNKFQRLLFGRDNF